MASRVIEDVLNMWECRVDERNMLREEELLESLSSDIVKASLLVSMRDLVGTRPYFLLGRHPKLKEVKEEESGVIRGRTKKLLTENEEEEEEREGEEGKEEKERKEKEKQRKKKKEKWERGKKRKRKKGQM
eukprot:gene1465-1619_t